MCPSDHNARISAKCNGTHLIPRPPGPLVSAAPVPGPVLRARDFSPGDLLCVFWPPGAAFLALFRV